MKRMIVTIGCVLLLVCSNAQTNTITIQADKKLATIQPTMWGLFFEDINFAADGGVYAEMVKNRSFEFNNPFMGWRRIMGRNPQGIMDVIYSGN